MVPVADSSMSHAFAGIVTISMHFRGEDTGNCAANIANAGHTYTVTDQSGDLRKRAWLRDCRRY
jgi:hypothetical protein